MLSPFLKFIVYIMFTFTVAHVISFEGFSLGTLSQYSEYSLTEMLQSVFVLISGVLFFLSARLNVLLKPVSLSLAALMLMIFIRELDFYLDAFVFDGAWQTIVFIVLVVTSIYLWKARSAFDEAVEHYSQLMSNGFLVCGLVIVLVFSRLMGREYFGRASLEKIIRLYVVLKISLKKALNY